ncbi:hypothetical protein K1T71_014822 [Dendrolimus kikuchii]|nr:hypothetical protein K1T71_014822 [Dendrolimus kikuchii]
MALPTNDYSCPVTRNRGALLKNRNEEYINSSMAEGIMIFTGEDVTYSSTKWAQEDNAEIFSWTAQQKLIIARRSLAGTAELWLRSEKLLKTYEELKSALQREFPDTVNMKEMHEIMSKRRRLKHESCYQYMLIIKELGKRAKFPDYVVIQYIIDGLPDYEQNKTILYGVTSFSMLKEQLSIYEKIQQKSRQQRERVVSSEKHNIKPKAGYSKTLPRRCYKCGEKGHMANYVNLYSLEVGANDVKPESSSFNQEHILEVSANDTKPQLSMSTCDNSDNANNNNIFTIDESSVKTNNKCVINVQLQEQWVKCLLDTGSDVNLVSVNVYRSLNVKKCCEENVKLVGLGHYTTRSIGKFFTNIIVDGFSYYTHFYIVPQGVIPYDIILGQPFLVSTILTIDKGTVIVRPISYDSSYLNCLPTNTEADNISNIPEVQSLINNYKPKKIKEAPIKMRIVLKNDIPVVQRPRRLALKEEEIKDLRKQLLL